jgi:hypothetical protein
MSKWMVSSCANFISLLVVWTADKLMKNKKLTRMTANNAIKKTSFEIQVMLSPQQFGNNPH